VSHKSGHIIIQSSTSLDDATNVVSSSTVELDFPSGMSLDERIEKIRHVMRVMERLDHADAAED
jgi:hypothetical protein